jgi:hypothetical protein
MLSKIKQSTSFDTSPNSRGYEPDDRADEDMVAKCGKAHLEAFALLSNIPKSLCPNTRPACIPFRPFAIAHDAK